MPTESDSSYVPVHDISCSRGVHFKRTLVFWSDAAKTIPLDITGDSFELRVINHKKITVLLFIPGDGTSIIPTNSLVLEKLAAQMNINIGCYYYSLKNTLADKKVMQGSFDIK